MHVEIRFDESYKGRDPKIIILTYQMTDDINNLVKKIQNYATTNVIAGYQKALGNVHILDQHEIIHIYTSEQKVYARTKESEYYLKFRLYELEERLDSNIFIRISNAEMVNIRHIIRLDMSMSGTIRLELSYNLYAYVSRRYITKIKRALGI